MRPVSRRGTCSAPQPRIHMLRSESPRSPGTSRPRPSTSGQVITTDSAENVSAADTAEKFRRGRRKPGTRTHAGSFSARYSSSKSTWMIAAVGTASSAPTNPSSSLPIAERHDHRDGVQADRLAHHLRHQHVVLDQLQDQAEAGDPERQGRATRSGRRPRRESRRADGPIIGIISPMPAIDGEHEKIRHAHEEVTKRRSSCR